MQEIHTFSHLKVSNYWEQEKKWPNQVKHVYKQAEIDSSIAKPNNQFVLVFTSTSYFNVCPIFYNYQLESVLAIYQKIVM